MPQTLQGLLPSTCGIEGEWPDKEAGDCRIDSFEEEQRALTEQGGSFLHMPTLRAVGASVVITSQILFR